MPKKETTSSRVSKIAGKGLTGGELKNEQAAVNASATSQDETPKAEKKEKKKKEKKEKKKKEKKEKKKKAEKKK